MPFLSRNSGSFFSGERPPLGKPVFNCKILSNITVTGKLTGGTVWGTNPYTDDSDWAVAAVHAGICAPGETVEIERYDGQNYAPYPGSFQNQVQTTAWATNWCGYKIRLAGAANPCGPYANVTITGVADGKVIGSNPYAIGTDVAAAAVHAGLCAPGETIEVVRYNPGLHAPYNGSFKNGIQSSTAIATNKCGYFIKKKEVISPKKTIFDYKSNAIQPYTVPAGVTLLKAKIWGAGGGGGKISGFGGGGGFIYVEFPVTPGEQLHVYVGRGGFPSGVTSKTLSNYIENESLPPVAFDPGQGDVAAGTGGFPGWPYAQVSGGMNVQRSIGPGFPWEGYNSGAGGGGPSGILRPSVPEWIAMAGGGGAAGDIGNGGPGGGADGGPGQASPNGGGGNPGLVGGPGQAGAGLYASVGLPGEPTTDTLAYTPARHLVGGGGGVPIGTAICGGGMGGGGYFGGGAGGPLAGGGGGAGFVKPGLTATREQGSNASYQGNFPPSLPGNFTDPEREDKGQGAPSANKKKGEKFYGLKGKDGRVIIWYD